MEKEKVISYLNINPTAKANKSVPKIIEGFNIGISIFIFVFAAFLFRPENLILYFIFFLWDIICFIFLLAYRNPLWEIPLTALGLISSSLKLFWGYIITSQFEFAEAQTPVFTWLHALVLVLAVMIVAYSCTRFYEVYKTLRDNSLTVAKGKIASQKSTPKWPAIIAGLSGSPMIFVRLFRDDFQNMGFGLGFCTWSLGIVFALIFAMLLPKLIVLMKFRVWNFSEFHH